MSTDTPELEYAGFWVRVWASLLDTLLILAIVVPVTLAVYGTEYYSDVATDSGVFSRGPVDFFMSYVFPAVAVIMFWVYKEATPGKMAFGIRIVDAATGEHASTAKYIGRYFAYIVAVIPLCLGLMWVGWDPKKQGWHDKLAGTVVLRKRRVVERPSFEGTR